MALLFTIFALLLGTVGFYTALPFLFHFIGRRLGVNLQSRSQQRRELLLKRAAEEEEARKLQRKYDGGHEHGQKSSSSTSLDEDWEKVDQTGARTPTKPAFAARKADATDFCGVIGFFHPFCNAGGGGERVLFAALLATQTRFPRALCVVYTGDHDASKDQILANARTRFNISLNPARIAFLYLRTRKYVLASNYPHFTLLGQSIGSLALGWDAFQLLPPDIFIDTMGYAFTLALSKWLFPKVPTGAYVHYPTISTDMLSSLHDKTLARGLNAGLGKGAKGKAKQFYWEVFAKLYAWVGGHVDVVMTNSSWTQNHIAALWSRPRISRGKKEKISVVYPPCAVEELQEKIPVDPESEKVRTKNLLYVAQFRPEKMHQTIIEAFHLFLKSKGTSDRKDASQPNLILVGSVRDDHDEKRVYKLRLQAQEIKDSVQFLINAKWSQVLQLLKESSIGVNGMWNEHFGIGVVEYQAAGLISVVNNSGGPKEDIVIPIDGKPTGFHASTVAEFVEAFDKALELSPEEAYAMRLRARKSSWRFSEQVFSEAWTGHLQTLVDMVTTKTNKS